MTPLFDELLTGGPAAVQALLGRHETLDLDFKARGQTDKETRRVLGKTLAAFANSIGGMIVYGVDCRKDADGIDQVIGFKPIEGVASFASQMRDWVVEAVMPRLADVRVEAIDAGGDSGFLLVAVERSERRPHRNEAGDKQYYRRTVGSSRPMEHFEVEDAFRRMSIPELQVEHYITSGGTIRRDGLRTHSSVRIAISLKNVSNISARDVFLIVARPDGKAPENVLTSNGISTRNEQTFRHFQIEGSVHPGTRRLLLPLQRPVVLSKESGVFRVDAAQLTELTREVKIAFGGLDMPLKQATVSIKAEEVLAAMPEHPV